jgi:Na+-driven multidrug efflux pump
MFAMIYFMLMQIPRGLAQTLCSKIGLEVGKGNDSEAKAYLELFIKFGIGFMGVELIIYIISCLTLNRF